MHYTANNKPAASDKTSVGIVFAKEPPKERVLTVALSNDRVRHSTRRSELSVYRQKRHFRTAARC